MACLARCVLSKDVPCALTQHARNTNIPRVVFPTCRFCFEVVLGNKTFHMKRNYTYASPPALQQGHLMYVPTDIEGGRF